jgi:hypothetical protein
VFFVFCLFFCSEFDSTSWIEYTQSHQHVMVVFYVGEFLDKSLLKKAMHGFINAAVADNNAAEPCIATINSLEVRERKDNYIKYVLD